MRAFRVPTRDRRHRLVAAAVSLCAALTLVTAPSAPADELGDKRRRVHDRIERAQDELRDSSRALVRATAQVQRAEKRLSSAERLLGRRRAELSAAQVLDAQMQSELEAATARLERARTALARGRRSHRAQEDVLRRIAADTYQAGSPALMGLTMVLNSQDPEELTSRLNVVHNVMGREAATLKRLEASSLLLQLQEQRVEEARADVAEQRKEAARSLERTQGLEHKADQAADRVAVRVRERTSARKVAAREKRADLRRLHQLRSERDKITRLIKRREARLQRQRSRAALARAKAASRRHTAPLLKPIDTYITSPYGMRLHPVYHRWTLHDGTDFGAGCGTPIRAAASGRVIARYYNVGYGNRVIIAHGYMRGVSVVTAYNHLSRYSTYVGERVSRGEVIGYVGTTGYSTGCHLHFMVFVNGHTVDPMKWL